MWTRCLTRGVPWILALAAAWLAFPATAQADNWRFTVTPYFWASDMKLDAKVNGDTVLAQDIDVSDLIDKVDHVFSAHAETATDKGGFFLDTSWTDLSDDTTRSGGGLASGTEIDAEQTLGIYEVGAFYHPTKPGKGFDVLFGVRVIDFKQDLAFKLPNGNETDTSSSSSLTDAFVGIRAGGPIGGPWDLAVRGDVGTGDTDLTWNALGTVGLHFGGKSQFAALFGWRQMSIRVKDTGTDKTVESGITLKGPIVGFTMSF